MFITSLQQQNYCIALFLDEYEHKPSSVVHCFKRYLEFIDIIIQDVLESHPGTHQYGNIVEFISLSPESGTIASGTLQMNHHIYLAMNCHIAVLM